jgi:hypothetical protein
MTVPHLMMTRSMQLVHGKLRPIIVARGFIQSDDQAILMEHFASESLFRRTAYATGFSDGGLQPSPALARMLANFVRNDACPEITVKTLLAGQKYEASGLWDLMCFAFIAQRSFDGLVELAAAARGFRAPEPYYGFDVMPPTAADLTVFMADTASEMAAGPAAVPISGVERVPDAA